MKIEKLKIPSNKGNLAAVIYHPLIKSNKLAILCPGYLDSKNYQHLIDLAITLSKHKYTTVRFNPTGTWESEGKISDYTTSQYLKDIKNVLEFMLKRAKYKQILLGGHSRGGQISILYAAKDPRINIVLGIMPSTNFDNEKTRKEWEKIGFRISKRNLPQNKNKHIEFHVPANHLKNWDQYDVIKSVKKIKSPIILIAGELDKNVTPQKVKKIFDNANEPKKFLLIPNIGHDYRNNKKEIAIINKKIIEQLNLIKK